MRFLIAMVLGIATCLHPRAVAGEGEPPLTPTTESASDPATLLRLAVQAAAEDDDEQRRHNLYFSAAALQARAGDLEGAKRTAAAYEGSSVARLHHSIARVQAESGDFEGAKSTAIDHAEGEEHLPEIYTAIARSQLEAGDHEGARETLAQALEAIERREDPRPWARMRTAVALAEAGDMARGLELVRELPADERRRVYQRMVAQRAAADDVAGAQQVIEAIAFATERAAARRHLAIAQAEGGDVEAAKQSAGEIVVRAERAMALAGIAQLEAEAGDPDGARRTLDQALDAAAAAAGRQRDTAHRSIGSVYAELGDFAEAQRVADLVEESSVRATALSNLAKTQADAGETEAARELLARAASATADRDAPDSMRQFRLASRALDLAAIGSRAEAMAAIERIEEPSRRSSAYSRFVEQLASAGELEHAEQVAARIDDDRESARAYVSIAESLLTAGEREAAQQMLRQASERIAEAHAERPRSALQAFRYLAEAQARIRDMVGLRQTLHAVGNPTHLRALASRHVAQAQVIDEAPVEDFLDWFDEIDEPYLKATALLHRAEALIETTR